MTEAAFSGEIGFEDFSPPPKKKSKEMYELI